MKVVTNAVELRGETDHKAVWLAVATVSTSEWLMATVLHRPETSNHTRARYGIDLFCRSP